MTDKNQNPKTPANVFGQTEDKSLESEQTESKDAAKTDPEPTTAGQVADVLANEQAATPETSDEDSIRVKMLHHGDHDGEALIPGETYSLPRRKALSLVGAHRAVTAD